MNLKKNEYHLCIIGAGVVGALFAIQMKRKSPDLDIIIVEKEEKSFKKVGETTSDLSAIYLNRVDIVPLLQIQNQKSGLRFIYEDDTEFLSPSYLSSANGYHLNRESFDQGLLELAQELGVEVAVAEIQSIEKQFEFNFDVKLEQGNFNTHWVVDCSGRAQFLKKMYQWNNNILVKQTASAWTHYSNVGNLPECRQSAKWTEKSIGKIGSAVTHLLGRGYWCWIIPLSDKTVSVGVTYSKHIYSHEAPQIVFDKIISENKHLKEFVSNAEKQGFYSRDDLIYLPEKIFDHGLLTLGDAAGFVDPMFSPGMEIAFSQIENVVDLFVAFFQSEDFDEKSWLLFEKKFLNTYNSRYISFEDKYEVMGNSAVFSNWIQLDIFASFVFYIIPISLGLRSFKAPVEMNFIQKFFYRFLASRYRKLAVKVQSSGSEVIFSDALVPDTKLGYIKVSIKLFFNWIKSYIKLEVQGLGLLKK